MSEKIQIYLNSKRANKYIDNNTSNCIFFLPRVNIKKNNNITISVLSMQLPYSFYNINYTNNKLTYVVNGVINTVYITPSNYNVNSLKDHIITLIGSDTFNIIYSASSNKFTFTNIINDFTLLHTNSNCFELLGLSEVDHFSVNRVLVSDLVCNLFTIRNIHIVSDNFILNNIDSFNPNNSNILASVPVNTIYNGVISYTNDHNVYSEINDVTNLTHLHIKLTDQDGDIINLNGTHFSITLLLTIK
jgi:hypothetical protein